MTGLFLGQTNRQKSSFGGGSGGDRAAAGCRQPTADSRAASLGRPEKPRPSLLPLLQNMDGYLHLAGEMDGLIHGSSHA